MHPYRAVIIPDGQKLQLMGGQFIAFGEHKDTKQPYRWENWEIDGHESQRRSSSKY